MIISTKFKKEDKAKTVDKPAVPEESYFEDSITLNEILERGISQGDNPLSFKTRIALQFLNDYPIHNPSQSLLEEDFCGDENIQGMSFVSTTLR